MVHMVTVKLSSTNFLLWRSQVVPLLQCQKYYGYIDGSTLMPSATTDSTAYNLWKQNDQLVMSLLLSSLTEEALSITIGFTTSRDIWNAIETAFSHKSKARELQIKDELHLMKRGSRSISEYSRVFKAHCDQLSAMGCPVEDTDKVHWYLRGLGHEFSSFSTTQLSLTPIPSFKDIVPKAESFDLFSKSIDYTAGGPSAYMVHSSAYSNRHARPYNNQNRYKGGHSNGGNRGKQQSRRSPRCQICREEGHYATNCKIRYTKSDANLVEALATCTISNDTADWYTDTGASAHMTPDVSQLDSIEPYTGKDRVIVGNGSSLPVTHMGSCSPTPTLQLKDVLVVPNLTKNLLSVSKLTNDFPLAVLFTDNKFIIQNLQTQKVVASGDRVDGLYVLKRGHHVFSAIINKHNLCNSFDIWHARLGHVSPQIISMLNKKGFLSLTSILPNPSLCVSCQKAKSHKLSFPLSDSRSQTVLGLIHCDLWGPAPINSISGYRYYAIFIDDNSRFTWFYPLKNKTDFYHTFIKFQTLVENQFSAKIKTFQSDGGGEFTSNIFQSHLDKCGIHHQRSCPYTPSQNGRAERKHRHITETGLTMLFHANVPLNLWVEAFSTAVFTINRLPTPVLNGVSPFEILYGKSPTYELFRIFGCLCFPYLRDYTKHKFEPRSLPCIFLGYNSSYKGFRCLDPKSHRVFITRHARFDETVFPSSSSHMQPSPTLSDYISFHDPSSSNSPLSSTHSSAGSQSLPSITPSIPCKSCALELPQSPPILLPPVSPTIAERVSELPVESTSRIEPFSDIPIAPAQHSSSNQNSHSMITRGKAGISKSKHYNYVCQIPASPLLSSLLAMKEPKGFKSAAKSPEWLAAMDDEIRALTHNHTWELVPRPPATNVVGSKWIFRIKYHSDGSIDRFKARLVAQGYTQLYGLDFHDTFSPVVRASTVRIVLSIAVTRGWNIRQLDVKNAFLHGLLQEEVFMEQPPGYIDTSHPHHVCRLKKAIYGLKQAPRAWFHRFSNFLLTIGFTCSKADYSLFVHSSDNGIIYLLLYVDDIVLTGSNASLIDTFIHKLQQEFSMKDLGNLHYFLGLEVTQSSQGLFLSQVKYARDILIRAELHDSKPIATPMIVSHHLTSDGPLFHSPTIYRSLVGSLQYLTITRPDITHAVNSVSQFMHAPRESHFQAVKRILRYVKGTLHFGLSISSSSHLNISAFSDADWAGCPETSRSTSGYAIFMGDNLISWTSKKQTTVSRSSAESEYRALALTAAEVKWLLNILHDLRIQLPAQPTLLCDNTSAIFMTRNPVAQRRSRHIDIDVHFVRELVCNGILQVKHVPSTLQIADIFTKSPSKSLFLLFRSKLRVLPTTLDLRGDVGDNSTLHSGDNQGSNQRENHS